MLQHGACNPDMQTRGPHCCKGCAASDQLSFLLSLPPPSPHPGSKVKGRVLVCADGATSQLATKLGYCTEAPRGVCSRAFVAGGTHNAKFDGVCFYPKWSLPGYAALFRCVCGGMVGGLRGWCQFVSVGIPDVDLI